MIARWLWRDEVCDRLSDQPPRWAEWVRWDGHVWSRRRRAAVASADLLASVVGASVTTEKRDGTIWVVVYDGWMACARRGDPLHVIWHSPLPEGTRVETGSRASPLQTVVGHGADAWVEVTVATPTPFTFWVQEGQRDRPLAAVAAAGRAGA